MLDGTGEIITGRERRRRWSDAEKLRIVAEAEVPGACFSHVAARYEVSRGLLWNWRAQVRRGSLRPELPGVFLPVQVSGTPLSPSPAVVSVDAVRAGQEPPRAVGPHGGADQIEVELPDGSKLRVGAVVGLVALRRVLSALRG